jgi:hypothetical protein
MKIIRKIPLGILYRIKNFKEKKLFNKYIDFIYNRVIDINVRINSKAK